MDRAAATSRQTKCCHDYCAEACDPAENPPCGKTQGPQVTWCFHKRFSGHPTCQSYIRFSQVLQGVTESTWRWTVALLPTAAPAQSHTVSRLSGFLHISKKSVLLHMLWNSSSGWRIAQELGRAESQQPAFKTRWRQHWPYQDTVITKIYHDKYSLETIMIVI